MKNKYSNSKYIIKNLAINKYLTIAGYSSDVYKSRIFRNKKKAKKNCNTLDTIIKIY